MVAVVEPVEAYRNAEVGRLRHVLRGMVPKRDRLEHQEERVEPKRPEEVEEEVEEAVVVVLGLIHHQGCLAHLGGVRSIGPGQEGEEHDLKTKHTRRRLGRKKTEDPL